MRFLDATIFIRFLTNDDEVKAAACRALFERVSGGQEEVFTTEVTIAEVVYVLVSPRLEYRLNHNDIHARLLPLLTACGLRLSQKTVCLRALEVFGLSRSLISNMPLPSLTWSRKTCRKSSAMTATSTVCLVLRGSSHKTPAGRRREWLPWPAS